jgi:hypothetical protein
LVGCVGVSMLIADLNMPGRNHMNHYSMEREPAP